ncbi:MAG: AI-2E family transporter [Gammaproteobacteria bacterium]|jgi:predicted PurR-regulated permease PerM
MNDNNLQRAFFLLLLVVITGAFLWLIRGFVQPIFWAVALAIVFYPAHGWIAAKLPTRPALSAFISVIAVLVVFVLPIIVLVAAVTAEATEVYQTLRSGDFSLSELYNDVAGRLPQIAAFVESLGIDVQGLTAQLSSSAVSISQFIASRALAIGQDTLRIAVFFVLMLYLLFFCLKDGDDILEGIVDALPFGDERERHFLERFAEVSRATIKGTLVIGIVQGAIGGVAFALLGIQAPVLWAVVMALLSIVPAIGPALVWLPAALILLFDGRIIAGIILIVIGAVIISLADNVLRPILVGRDTRMPDYLVLLSTLGGLTAFGLAGVVIGPIIAAFLLSVWAMAVEEFADFDEPKETEQTDGENA